MKCRRAGISLNTAACWTPAILDERVPAHSLSARDMCADHITSNSIHMLAPVVTACDRRGYSGRIANNANTEKLAHLNLNAVFWLRPFARNAPHLLVENWNASTRRALDHVLVTTAAGIRGVSGSDNCSYCQAAVRDRSRRRYHPSQLSTIDRIAAPEHIGGIWLCRAAARLEGRSIARSVEGL